MTAPRQIVPGRTYLVTRRCTQRQFLLRPDARTNAIIAYCLGDAAARYDIQLIAWCVMSNHYHAVVHDPLGKLPAFIEHLHKMLARALNARWKRWENLWSSEETCATYLPTAEAVFASVVYVLANPTSGHLVDRLVDWPGCTALHHFDGRRTEHQRPVGFFRPKGPTPESTFLATTQPPCSRAIETAGEWAQRVRVAVDNAERIARDERVREGRRVLGRKAILRTSAFESPTTPAAHRKLRPAVACSDKHRRIAELRALVYFRRCYRAARLRFIAGERTVEFPAGTYRLRFWGVSCAVNQATAIAA